MSEASRESIGTGARGSLRSSTNSFAADLTESLFAGYSETTELKCYGDASCLARISVQKTHAQERKKGKETVGRKLIWMRRKDVQKPLVVSVFIKLHHCTDILVTLNLFCT